MRTPLLFAFAALAGTAGAASPDYALTVYSSASPGEIRVETLANYGTNLPGYALVQDRRPLTLAKGLGSVRVSDVATRIDPTTVSFASLTDPDGTRVLEQNYEFDLVSQTKLLERYLGQRITVEQLNGDSIERIEGTLLSASGGLILARDSGEVVTLNSWNKVQFPALPGGLITKPTLVWLVNAQRGGEHDAKLSYQTGGMTWWTDYNISLREGDGRCDMDLAAWVTLVNQSGASYPNARLKLVAGEVNRAPVPQPMMRGAMMAVPAPAAMAEAGFEESSLFEYHLYTLGRRTDLPENSTKQLELFPAATRVACRKHLVFTADPAPWHYGNEPVYERSFGASRGGKTSAWLEFENAEKNRLGVPLPAGRIRVNQQGPDGSLEFIGEDLIGHTPRNETVRIKLGESFDIVGERTQTHFNYDEKARVIEERFEISVRNRKKTGERVVVREHLSRWSGWTITDKTHDYAKRDAQTVDFTLDIPADGTATVGYTVRYRW